MGGEYTYLKQNLYMRAFCKAGATDRGRAKPLAELGIRPGAIFRHMVNKGIFVAVGGESYYLDENAADEFIAARRKRAFYMLVLMLLALLFLWIFGGKLFH